MRLQKRVTSQMPLLYQSPLSTGSSPVHLSKILKFPCFQIFIAFKGKVQKKKEKNLTSVSFAFTHTYTPVKTNIFRFFPQAYMENFEKCAKTEKQKKNILSHVPCNWLKGCKKEKFA